MKTKTSKRFGSATAKHESNGTTPSIDDPGHVPGADDPTPADRDESDQEKKILSLLKNEQLANGTIALKRRAVNESQFGHLTELPVENFSVELVAKLYGGGDYRAIARTSRNTIVTNFAFKVDYAIPAKHPNAPAPGTPPAPESKTDLPALIAAVRTAIGPAGGGGGDTPILVAMIGMMQAVSVESSKANAAAAAEQAKANAELMKALLNQGKGGSQDSVLLQRISDLERELKSNRGGLKDFAETVAVIDSIRGDKSDDDKPSPFERTLTKIAEAVAPIIQAKLGMPQPQRRTLAAATPANGATPGAARSTLAGATEAAAPVETNPQATQLENIENQMTSLMVVLFQQFKPRAIQAAEEKKDPEEFTMGLLSLVPPTYEDSIYKAAAADNWFENLFGNDAAAEKHREFLTKVREVIVSELAPDPKS